MTSRWTGYGRRRRRVCTWNRCVYVLYYIGCTFFRVCALWRKKRQPNLLIIIIISIRSCVVCTLGDYTKSQPIRVLSPSLSVSSYILLQSYLSLSVSLRHSRLALHPSSLSTAATLASRLANRQRRFVQCAHNIILVYVNMWCSLLVAWSGQCAFACSPAAAVLLNQNRVEGEDEGNTLPR